MTWLVRMAALAPLLALSPAAAGPNPPSVPCVPEQAGITTFLDDHTSAVTYWVREADGIRVVTTVGRAEGEQSDAPSYAVVRFSELMMPGQTELVSVPAAPGERTPTLRVHRLADQAGDVRIQIDRADGNAT